jgi:hypothetical protein
VQAEHVLFLYVLSIKCETILFLLMQANVIIIKNTFGSAVVVIMQATGSSACFLLLEVHR